MVYLIVSVVAGLVFLISGKVKYGSILYLEGTKARLAGLIFLGSPVLVILIILAALSYESTGNVSDLSTFEQGLDTLGTTLVSNGVLIGLAYINFHWVSRQTKERGGCLTYGLAYLAFIAVSLIYISLPNFDTGSPWFRNVLIGISVLQLISILGIWLWKKWGVVVYAVLLLISPVIAFLNTEAFLPVLISLIQSLTLALVLYLLVKPKWQFFE